MRRLLDTTATVFAVGIGAADLPVVAALFAGSRCDPPRFAAHRASVVVPACATRHTRRAHGPRSSAELVTRHLVSRHLGAQRRVGLTDDVVDPATHSVHVAQGQISRRYRVVDDRPGASREDQLGSRRPHLPRSLNRYRDDREIVGDGDPKRPLLEGLQLAVVAAGFLPER